jgi:hypothetical protein
MSNSMPKPFQGYYGPGQGLNASYVNVTPPRFVDGREETFWNNPHEANARRGYARGADGQNRGRTVSGGGSELGGR